MYLNIGNLTLIAQAPSHNAFSLQGNSQRRKERSTFLSQKTQKREHEMKRDNNLKNVQEETKAEKC